MSVHTWTRLPNFACKQFANPWSKKRISSIMSLQRNLEVYTSCKKKIYLRKSKLYLENNRFYAAKVLTGSKYHPLSALELTELKLRELFFNKKHLETEEWSNVKSDLLAQFLNLTEENFDSIIMNSLLSLNNIYLAHSFMKYLKEISHRPNLVTCMKYMTLCSKHPEACKQELILETFSKIKPTIDSSPVLDNATVDCVVRGLCATEKWKSAFDYLEKLPLNNPLFETKNALCCAALENGEENLAWNIMTTWYRPAESPGSKVMRGYLSFVSKLDEKNVKLKNNYLEKFLFYLQKKNIIIKSDVAEDVKSYFERQQQNWIIKDTKINKLGVCSGCHKALENAKLSNAEFHRLQDMFLNKVVKKSDIFINSTAYEVHKFLTYVQKNKPFDIVLDGLNAAHTVQDVKIRKSLAIQLLEVVKRLTVSSQRVLIIGKKHMYGWPRNIMSLITQRASIFFASNISEDDPFVIYAALMSGPDTLFVSSDLMRDHISRLDDPTLIRLFHVWQQSHQIFLKDTENGPMFDGPLKHHISIQGHMYDGWHIPYDDEFILDPYEELNNWICIQRVS